MLQNLLPGRWNPFDLVDVAAESRESGKDLFFDFLSYFQYWLVVAGGALHPRKKPLAPVDDEMTRIFGQALVALDVVEVQTRLVPCDDRVDGPRRGDSHSVNSKESDEQSVIRRRDDERRWKIANVKGLAFLYPLVGLKPPVPGTPQVIRCAIHRRSVVLVTNKAHLLLVDALVLENCVQSKHGTPCGSLVFPLQGMSNGPKIFNVAAIA